MPRSRGWNKKPWLRSRGDAGPRARVLQDGSQLFSSLKPRKASRSAASRSRPAAREILAPEPDPRALPKRAGSDVWSFRGPRSRHRNQADSAPIREGRIGSRRASGSGAYGQSVFGRFSESGPGNRRPSFSKPSAISRFSRNFRNSLNFEDVLRYFVMVHSAQSVGAPLRPKGEECPLARSGPPGTRVKRETLFCADEQVQFQYTII